MHLLCNLVPGYQIWNPGPWFSNIQAKCSPSSVSFDKNQGNIDKRVQIGEQGVIDNSIWQSARISDFNRGPWFSLGSVSPT